MACDICIHDTYICDATDLPCTAVGSLKLQVSFAKEPCKRDNILQKRPIIVRSLLIVATLWGIDHALSPCYGVTTISRLLKIIGLFCRILSLLQGSFAKETYTLKEPTNCSHPIQKRIMRSIYVMEYTYMMRVYVMRLVCLALSPGYNKFVMRKIYFTSDFGIMYAYVMRQTYRALFPS